VKRRHTSGIDRRHNPLEQQTFRRIPGPDDRTRLAALQRQGRRIEPQFPFLLQGAMTRETSFAKDGLHALQIVGVVRRGTHSGAQRQPTKPKPSRSRNAMPASAPKQGNEKTQHHGWNSCAVFDDPVSPAIEPSSIVDPADLRHGPESFFQEGEARVGMPQTDVTTIRIGNTTVASTRQRDVQGTVPILHDRAAWGDRFWLGETRGR